MASSPGAGSRQEVQPMSAYIVDPAHIDVMLSVAINVPEGIRSSQWGLARISRVA